MKRWQDIINQDSNEKHDAQVLNAVERELAEIRQQNRRQFWRRSLIALVPSGAMAALAVLLWKKSPTVESDLDMDLLAFAAQEGIEAAEVEWIEDLDLLEDLDDLEAWDEKSEA